MFGSKKLKTDGTASTSTPRSSLNLSQGSKATRRCEKVPEDFVGGSHSLEEENLFNLILKLISFPSKRFHFYINQ